MKSLSYSAASLIVTTDSSVQKWKKLNLACLQTAKFWNSAVNTQFFSSFLAGVACTKPVRLATLNNIIFLPCQLCMYITQHKQLFLLHLWEHINIDCVMFLLVPMSLVLIRRQWKFWPKKKKKLISPFRDQSDWHLSWTPSIFQIFLIYETPQGLHAVEFAGQQIAKR